MSHVAKPHQARLDVLPLCPENFAKKIFQIRISTEYIFTFLKERRISISEVEVQGSILCFLND